MKEVDGMCVTAVWSGKHDLNHKTDWVIKIMVLSVAVCLVCLSSELQVLVWLMLYSIIHGINDL